MKNAGDLKIIWIDFTNAPHVLALKPLIVVFEGMGYKVVVTARNFSQTIPLLRRFGIKYTEIGSHRGGSVIKKSFGFFNRTANLISFAKKCNYKFGLALSHGSNDLAAASFILGIPHVTMFDYEHAAVSHHINFRLSKKVICPDVIDKKALARYSRKDKLDQYSGLKEEYYLYGWEPDAGVLEQLNLDTSRVTVVVRTPPDMALYHRFENDLFWSVIKKLSKSDAQVVVLPRTKEQGEKLRETGDSLIIPKNVVDAQSLIFYADLVISAGGTMNREAVVLGTPVYTIFSGKLGAVDLDLIKKDKMFKLRSPEQVVIRKKKQVKNKLNFRNPEVLVQKILAVAK